MPDPRRALGTAGESLAEAFLRARGMRCLARQVRTPHGEIDLVCREGEEWAFVEVKTRRSRAFGPPEAAITPAKLRHMRRAAEHYLQQQGRAADPWRLDVVAILLEGESPEIVHFPAVDTAYGG
jgi:putative endonuclease